MHAHIKGESLTVMNNATHTTSGEDGRLFIVPIDDEFMIQTRGGDVIAVAPTLENADRICEALSTLNK